MKKKRSFSERGLIVSTLGFAMSATLWVGSYFTDHTTDHLLIDTTGRSQDAPHLLLRRGHLWLFDRFENDVTGAVQPIIVETPVVVAGRPYLAWGRRRMPGAELNYCRLPVSEYLIWSARVALWLPTALALAGMAWFSLWARQARGRPAAPEEAPVTSPHSPPAGGP